MISPAPASAPQQTNQRTYEIWGNWKMNPPMVLQAQKLAGDTAAAFNRLMKNDERYGCVCVGLFVPHGFFVPIGNSLTTRRAYGGLDLQLGVQNMYYQDKGAFTGEHSPLMISSLFECLKPAKRKPTVLIGHSERRDLFGEDNALINKKMLAAYEHDIRPFLAIGEQLMDRSTGMTNDVLEEQLSKGLAGVSAEQFLIASTVIAYEPVWAIGTGKTATPEIANEAHAHIRSVLSDMYGEVVAGQTSIQYGGSMNPENAAALLAMEHIDGGLIGGAALNAQSFIGIVSAVPKMG